VYVQPTIRLRSLLIDIDLMLVADNVTRWNSTFRAIHRALKLQSRIVAFCRVHVEDLQADTLTDEEWEELRAIDEILLPLQAATKRLEGKGRHSHHGSIWEVFPVVESVISHLDRMKRKYPKSTHPELADSINLAWEKLDEYYAKLDEAPAYAVALVLHPRYRYGYFKQKWVGALRKYYEPMRRACKGIYDEEYLPQPAQPTQQEDEEQPKDKRDFTSKYLDDYAPEKIVDQWDYYATADAVPIPETCNLYQHWSEQVHLPGVRQMAYDHLSIPAMSSECERVFSDTKLTISPIRNRLEEEIIEATECQVQWIRAGY
jgi:hAT family C-terminal dimerisation region